MLTKAQQEVMEKIFDRYHKGYIEPTPAFVAQACFDVGTLQGIIWMLEDQLQTMQVFNPQNREK